MILKLAHLPKPILRTPVVDVTFPLSKPVLKLCKDMLQTVEKANGVGLAAPQVHHNLNLALIYAIDFEVEPFFIFNPRIIEQSEETTVVEEGCLSLPGLYGTVARPKKITLEAQNSRGEIIKFTDDTFIARILQHEIDHLQNTLIIDKLEHVTKHPERIKKYADARAYQVNPALQLLENKPAQSLVTKQS